MSTTRISLAHGFTQTERSWNHIETLLAERLDKVETIAVDMPGHGTAADLRADLWGAAEHLVDAAGEGTYVGYSMGGRVALHAALARPDKVRRLILVGATAGIIDDDERAKRCEADERLAARIETEPLTDFIDAWLRNPLFAGLSEAAAFRSDRLRNTSAGLASSLRLCGTGTQEPLWDRLSEITVPTLILAGADDPKFCELGGRLTDGIPNAQLSVIEGSGHSVHLEQPSATADAIAEFVQD